MRMQDLGLPIVWVNFVATKGVFNGNVNLTLGAYNFTPTENEVAPDPVIVGRLRMDKVAAIHLRDALNEMIENLETGPQPIVEETDEKVEGVIAPRKTTKRAATH